MFEPPSWGPLSSPSEVVRLWRADGDFAEFYSELLSRAPSPGFFWEFRGNRLSNTTRPTQVFLKGDE